jgi:dipeptidyl aminopeptidase/acylaminoacyl peptidase
MNRYILFAAMLAVIGAPPVVRAEQPPIIDRNLFFGDTDIRGELISPNGQFISFLKPYNGTRNIWIKKTSEPFSVARPVSAEARRPVSQYIWSWDSKFILYVQDFEGDENFNVYALDPTLPVDPKTGVPPTRALTNLKGVRTFLYAVPRAKPDIIYIGLNDRDRRWHDLYQLELSSGEKMLIRENTERITNWIFDHNAKLRLAERLNEAGDKEFLRVDHDGLKVVYSCSVQENCVQQGFDAQNKLVYLVTNKGPLDLTELQMLDPESGATTPVETDPEKRVDFGGVILSTVDYRMLFTKYEDDGVRRYFKDHTFEEELRWLESQLPGKEVRLGARTSDESLWVVSARSDTEPGEFYVWNLAAKTLVPQYRFYEELPRDALSQRKPYHFKSSDGLDIPAFLTLPKGLPSKNLALIVNPHGGPWAQDLFGYNPFAEFLANRGYAVLQPNFRGSTGYGKAYLNAGDRQWGRKMQDDLTWGIKALVADGIVDPKRVGIIGASYGGYATLAGVAFTPELYAAAVDIVGPSNLITLYETIPPYWESALKSMYTRLGDPTTPEGRAMLMEQSPLTRAKAIVTPLMVFQGKNDPRVNVRESNQIVAAVRDNGKPIEYFIAPDEGHGFVKPINNLAMAAAMEKFLAKHLGGRYQENVPPDVAGRLKEFAVDPSTVH